MTHRTTGQAIEFFEIDVPYCSLLYGVAPCQAFLEGGVTRGYVASFQASQLHGWVPDNGSLTAGPDYATVTQSAADTSIAVTGLTFAYVLQRAAAASPKSA